MLHVRCDPERRRRRRRPIDGAIAADGDLVDAPNPKTDGMAASDVCKNRVALPVGGGCIDPKEVTTGEYQQFAVAVGIAPIDAGDPQCSAVTIVAPGTGSDDIPMTNVSFCAAKAYCEHSA